MATARQLRAAGLPQAVEPSLGAAGPFASFILTRVRLNGAWPVARDPTKGKARAEDRGRKIFIFHSRNYKPY